MDAKDYNRDWSCLFRYDESSPSGLVWNIGKVNNGKLSNDRVGKPVGSRNGEYWMVGLSVNGSRKSFLCHRIIAVMMYGNIDPDKDVDHINRDKTDNRLSNLRVVSKSDNMRNKDMRSDNTTGIIGVTYEGEGYRAQFRTKEGKLCRRYFSVAKYGTLAVELAVQWREKGLKNDCST